MQDCPHAEGDAPLVDLADTLVAAGLVLAGDVHPEPVVHQLPAKVGRLYPVTPVVAVVANQPVLTVIVTVLGEDLDQNFVSFEVVPRPRYSPSSRNIDLLRPVCTPAGR